MEKCSSQPDIHFVSEDDMDNCVIERIIRNEFDDPMIPNESEDDRNKQTINWSEVFKKKDKSEEPPTMEIQENTNPVENMDEEEGNLVINEDLDSDIMTDDSDDDSLPADDPPYKSPTSQSPKLQSERTNSPTRLSPIITRSKSPMGPTDELLSKSPLSPKENQSSCTNTIRSPRQSTCDSPEGNTNDLPSKSLQTSLTLPSPRKDPESSKEHEQEEMDCGSSKIKNNCVNGTENGKKKTDDFYNCTFNGSVFERPPPRSFRRWEVRNWTTHHNIDIIVHCFDKMKLQGQAEVIAEPIPKYQTELCACKQSEHKIKSLTLSLMLRKNASLLNVRIDCEKGDMVRVDNILFIHNTAESETSNAVYDTVSQLQGLLSGRYILQHEPAHDGALLFVSRSMGSDKTLTLDFDLDVLTELAESKSVTVAPELDFNLDVLTDLDESKSVKVAPELDFNLDVLTELDESKSVKVAPELTPLLLPCHKYRKMLPCAFTPYENQVAKVVPKPPPKTKLPPQALRIFQLLRNIMGRLGNVAEVAELRPQLMDKELLQVFYDLLDSSIDGIEVSYNAAGVLAHMASDGPEAWTVDEPSREAVLERVAQAVERWDLHTERNINYRSFEPILSLLHAHHTPQCQHWAVWTLANLTTVYPDKYCGLVESEGGLTLLKELIRQPEPYAKIKKLACIVIDKCCRWSARDCDSPTDLLQDN